MAARDVADIGWPERVDRRSAETVQAPVQPLTRGIEKVVRRRVDALSTRLNGLLGELHAVTRRLRPRLDRAPDDSAQSPDVRVPLTAELALSLAPRLSTDGAGRWVNRIPAA